MKTVLMCGNGRSEEILPEVETWGYRVALISDYPRPPQLADEDAYERANTLDPADALRAAQRLTARGWRFDAVLSLCWDCPISVSTIAEHYGLHAIPVAVAERATYKHRRIAALRDAGIPVANFKAVAAADLAPSAVTGLRYPIVCKPVDLSGSTGVVLIESADVFWPAVKSADIGRALSKFDLLLFEEFLEGVEYSAEGLMIDGGFEMTGVSERVFDKSARPQFVEIGDVMPTLLEGSMLSAINDTCEKACRALDILTGIAKFDLLLSGETVYVLEVTPRLGGPRFGTEMIPLSNGTNLLRAAIQQATGEPIDMSLLRPRAARGMVAFTVFASRGGRIRAIEGLDDVRRLRGFYDFKWWKEGGYKPGDRVTAGKKLGYYIVSADSRNEALTLAREVERNLGIAVQ